MDAQPDFRDAISIEVYLQMPGVPTRIILANCLYRIEDPNEIQEIIRSLHLIKLSGETQRKAVNWLIFRLKNGKQIKTDLDQEAGELRITAENQVQEYKISAQAGERLNLHIQKARPLYEKLTDKTAY